MPIALVGSVNALVGFDAAWTILDGGGSALDAVEAAVRIVEANPDDHTVGYGGYPNILGDVELDASIMEGTSRDAGAVGALKGYRHAITVARAVLERLPHVLVVGDGAAQLAAEIGLEREDLLTEEAARVWRAGLEGKEDALATGGVAARMLSHVTSLTADPERAPGTVNVLALDEHGRLASAVSTSGWAWKYPGRLGDSPIIGAGNYCDSRYAAAGCTGWGELAIRAGSARSIVDAVARGESVEQACLAAIADVRTLERDRGRAIMHVVALDREGRHCGASTDEAATYAYRVSGMSQPDIAPRLIP